MSAKNQVSKEIREAYVFLRKENNTIPSETLQFMLDTSLEKLNREDGVRLMTEEDRALMRMETVSQFIEHCKDHGIEISDVHYEEFFGA